jgi:hypothetical protein
MRASAPKHASVGQASRLSQAPNLCRLSGCSRNSIAARFDALVPERWRQARRLSYAALATNRPGSTESFRLNPSSSASMIQMKIKIKRRGE